MDNKERDIYIKKERKKEDSLDYKLIIGTNDRRLRRWVKVKRVIGT